MLQLRAENHCLIFECFVKFSLATTTKGFAIVHIEVRQDGVVIDLDQVETLFVMRDCSPII